MISDQDKIKISKQYLLETKLYKWYTCPFMGNDLRPCLIKRDTKKMMYLHIHDIHVKNKEKEILFILMPNS